jgi:uncharacterized protein HemX
MSEQAFGPVTKAVASAQELAALGPTAIWALLCLSLIVYTVWKQKNEKKSEEGWMKIRTDEIVVDSKQADAMNALSAGMNHLTEKIVVLETEVKVLCSVFSKGNSNQ